MHIGQTIAIFLIIAAATMVMFCLVAHYFNKRLCRAFQEQNEIYSLMNSGDGDTECEAQGDYEDFVIKRNQDLKQKERKIDKKYNIMLEMTKIDEPFNFGPQSIYSPSPLKMRLETPSNLQSARSAFTSKSFRPQKIQSHRENSNVNHRQKLKDSDEEAEEEAPLKKNIQHHEFISKMIAYSDDGLCIIEYLLKEVWIESQGGLVLENKKQKKTFLKYSDINFLDTLEAYGFQKNLFEVFKFVTVFEIINMEVGKKYQVSSLKTVERKEQMNFASFYMNEGEKYEDKNKIVDTFERE